MRYRKPLALLMLFVFLMAGNLWAKTPIGMLTEPQGTVEYSKNGKKWKKVRRNVFLYEEYMFRTGADGSVKFINQGNNQTTAIPADTEAKVVADGLQATKGQLGEQQSAGDLVSGLGDKFVKTQKYTTVRRSAKKPGIQLKVGNVVVIDDYADIAWSNVGSQYSYKVHVGEKDRKTKEWKEDATYEVPATDDPLVRTTVKPPRKHLKYFVEVMEGGQVVYTTKTQNLKRMTPKKLKEFTAKADQAKSMDESGFLYANLLTDYGLLVGAMDTYEQFFTEYSDDEDVNELRPFLIEIYARLYLEEVKDQAIKDYNAKM
jgi:hypothetical protein